MSRSRGKLGKAIFCPWCGTKTLQRDTFSNDTNAEHTHVSYICETCCEGFSLRPSPRALFVNRMYAEERARRGPNTTSTSGGSPPLIERPLAELKDIERILLDIKPRGKADRESVAESLRKVREAISTVSERQTP